jgi:hypothetical protein
MTTTMQLAAWIAAGTLPAGALGFLVRARLAAADQEAIRRGHRQIGGRFGTKVYSSKEWTLRRTERDRAVAAELAKRQVRAHRAGRKLTSADVDAIRRDVARQFTVDRYPETTRRHNAVTPQPHNAVSAVQS